MRCVKLAAAWSVAGAMALGLSACNGAPPFKPTSIQGSSGNYMDDFYDYGARGSIPDTARGMTITPADLAGTPKSLSSSGGQ